MSDARRTAAAPRRVVAYRALAEQLRSAIRMGEFSDDRPLPTEEQLAATHAVSRSTVRRAMQDLVAEGVIYRVAGRGTFPVRDPDRYLRHLGSIEDLMALSSDTDCEIIHPLRRAVDIEAAGRLRLDDDAVMTMTLRRLYGSAPIAVTTIALAPRVGALLTDVEQFTTEGMRSRFTVIGTIDARIPHLIAGAEQSITAAAAPEAVAKNLACDRGDPVLRVDRLYLDSDGRPVELATSHFNPAYYTYRVKLRRRLP